MFVVSEWPVLRGPALGADPGQPSGFLEGVGASSDSSSLCGSSSTSPSPFELTVNFIKEWNQVMAFSLEFEYGGFRNR